MNVRFYFTFGQGKMRLVSPNLLKCYKLLFLAPITWFDCTSGTEEELKNFLHRILRVSQRVGCRYHDELHFSKTTLVFRSAWNQGSQALFQRHVWCREPRSDMHMIRIHSAMLLCFAPMLNHAPQPWQMLHHLHDQCNYSDSYQIVPGNFSALQTNLFLLLWPWVASLETRSRFFFPTYCSCERPRKEVWYRKHPSIHQGWRSTSDQPYLCRNLYAGQEKSRF